MRQENEKNIGIFSRVYADVDTKIFKLVSNLELAEKPLVRKVISEMIRGIEVGEIPDSLSEAAVLTSNYPGVGETLRAIMKIGCELPGQELRLLAIARKEVVINKNPVLGGFLREAVLPAEKDGTGKYSLGLEYTIRALKHLNKNGVLWLSPTGNTGGNGLRVEDLRYGVVTFAQKAKVPIVPVGLITDDQRKIRQVKFGEAIVLAPLDKVSLFDRDRYLHLSSILVLAKIAALLPPGQRGDFEDTQAIINQTEGELAIFNTGSK